MKKLTVSIITAMTISTASLAHVTENKGPNKSFRSVIYPSSKTMKLNLVVEKIKGQKVVVRILDNNGYLLYSQRLARNIELIHTRFNLSQLTDGKYTIEVSDGSAKEIKEVNVSTKASEPTTTYRLITMR